MIEAAALLSLLTRDWNDFLVITTLLLFNAVIGFREEASAANALNRAQGTTGAQGPRVARRRMAGNRSPRPGAGRHRPHPFGDIIPADVKLIEGDHLSVDQAALTGESLPVDKKTGEVAFSGSIAKQGEMVAVVTAPAQHLFFGRTAKLVETAGAKSHLQESVLTNRQLPDFLRTDADRGVVGGGVVLGHLVHPPAQAGADPAGGVDSGGDAGGTVGHHGAGRLKLSNSRPSSRAWKPSRKWRASISSARQDRHLDPEPADPG